MAYKLSADLGPKALAELLNRFFAESVHFSGIATEEYFEARFDGSKLLTDYLPEFGTVHDRVERLRTREQELAEGPSRTELLRSAARGEAEPFVKYFLRGGNPAVLLFGTIEGRQGNSVVETRNFPEIKELVVWIVVPFLCFVGAFILSRSSAEFNEAQQKVLGFSVALLAVLPMTVTLRVVRFLSHRQRARLLLDGILQTKLPAEIKELRERQLQEGLYYIDASERRRLSALRWLLVGVFCLWFLSSTIMMGSRL